MTILTSACKDYLPVESQSVLCVGRLKFLFPGQSGSSLPKATFMAWASQKRQITHDILQA